MNRQRLALRLLTHCIKVGRFFSIDVRIHWSFWVLPVLFAVATWQLGAVGAALVVAALFAGFGCVVLHEYGHALAARQFGVKTRDIILTPLGGIARLEHMPENPIEEILVALAGPAVNVVLCAALLVLLAFAPHPPSPDLLSSLHVRSWVDFAVLLMGGNVGMIVLNMLPAFPSDGGRVFRAFLCFFLRRVPATRAAVYVGTAVAVGLAILGIIYNAPQMPFIAVLFACIGHVELWAVRQQAAMEGRRWVESYLLTPEHVALLTPPEADFSGYSWDAKGLMWVEWRGGRAVRKCRMRGA